MSASLISEELAKRLKAMANAQQAMDQEAGDTWTKDLEPIFKAAPSRATLTKLRGEVSRASADAEGQIRDVPSSISIQLMLLKDFTTDASPGPDAGEVHLSEELAKKIKALAATHQELENLAAAVWKDELMPIFEANPTREICEQLRAEVTRAAADDEGLLRDLPANIDISLKMLRFDPRTKGQPDSSAPAARRPRP
ncbi:hypothetical protein ABIC83_002381 [Roseateles asaccharophilus]|uniref:hypothetical protein n=1 Tax=Roseateles asaccharophilus TaxID=582607 RepID=UPI00383791E8